MNKLLIVAITMLLTNSQAMASAAYGDLNNFDAVNDTGQECHGLEIELEGVHSTEITYTYDWSRYGTPIIREDLAADGVTPRVFVRFESKKDPATGAYLATTVPQDPLNPFPATQGHQCTDPSAVPAVCDHFGVGYYPTAADPTTTPPTPAKPSLVRYNWLVENPGSPGTLVLGPALNVATPVYTYTPPVPALNQPALVQAVIQAPPPPQPELAPPVPAKFGEAIWAKEIKTSSKNDQPIKLEALVDDDPSMPDEVNWLNDKVGDGVVVEAQTEIEWRMMQTEFAKLNDPNNPGGANGELAGAPEELPNGDEIVTRRYEFYRYAADDMQLNPDITDGSSIDGETGEAMCSEVNPTTDPASPAYLHGLTANVTVTDANGDSYIIDCTKRIVVGNYLGAQMAGFNPNNELGLIEHIQDWDTTQADGYPPRSVIIGGTQPYSVTLISGGLPSGLSLDPTTGVLSQTGNPTPGLYDFTLAVSDSSANPLRVEKSYSVRVGDPSAVLQYPLLVAKTGNGTGTISGANGEINCGATCSAWLTVGSSVSLLATPDVGSLFSGWSLAACSGINTICNVTMDGSKNVTATFTLQQLALSVTRNGTGSGTVIGNGINCGNLCTATLDYGSAVTLTATPAVGSQLANWSGCASSTATTCTTTMDTIRNITATFNLKPSSYKLNVSLSGSGSVTSSPKGISCGKTCSKSFATDSNVTLIAKPARKHLFIKWMGTACNGQTTTSCTVPITQDHSITAVFN